MSSVRKYINVWVEKRKNPPRKDGTVTYSYTLEWNEFGRRRFMSLGRTATLEFARRAAKIREKELNSPEEQQGIDPITWEQFREKYLGTNYPGWDSPPKDRRVSAKWSVAEITP